MVNQYLVLTVIDKTFGNNPKSICYNEERGTYNSSVDLPHEPFKCMTEAKSYIQNQTTHQYLYYDISTRIFNQSMATCKSNTKTELVWWKFTKLGFILDQPVNSLE